MKKSLLIPFIILMGGIVASVYFFRLEDHHHHDHDDDHHSHSHSHSHSHDDHEEQGPIELSDAVAAAAGIGTVQIAPRTLQQHLAVFGTLMPDPETQWQIRARFPGLVRSVNVRVGSRVAAGDVLATVEANDSLRVYNLVAPGDGTVIERLVNPGETVGEAPLLVLSDPRQLLLQLAIFPMDHGRVQADLPVRVEGRQGPVKGRIRALVASPGAPLSFALVPLSNADQAWVSGEVVRAQIVLGAREVPICVENRALQTLEAGEAVFVKNGTLYEPRLITRGETDGRCTEILSGLNPGEHYVADNAYLLKAELEKSGAAHDH